MPFVHVAKKGRRCGSVQPGLCVTSDDIGALIPGSQVLKGMRPHVHEAKSRGAENLSSGVSSAAWHRRRSAHTRAPGASAQ